MAGQLFTFPLRFGLRVARGAVRGGMQVTGRAVGAATSVVRAATSGGSPAPAESPRRGSAETPHRRTDTPEADTPQRESEPSGSNGGAPDPRTQDRDEDAAGDTGSSTATLEPEQDPAEHAAEAVERVPESPAAIPAPEAEPTPPHIAEEATLVQSVAEPGAEQGAGAQVTIAEPWEGYTTLNARQVISRLSQSSPAELAAVELFERAHKNRETVFAAVARQAKTQSGNRPAADQTTKE